MTDLKQKERTNKSCKYLSDPDSLDLWS